MPYNTRRKSLSLSELGIILPKRSRTQSHPSPPNTVASGEEPPVKRSKRSHPSQSPPPSSAAANNSTRTKSDKTRAPVNELSPPPSPIAESRINKVDVEGINDDIVVATIQQLEQTGNRPHLVKELAAILSSPLGSAEKSSNPSALISSRLTAYINRSWPTVSPCPLAKDLSTSHPRRLYFFLTTMPRQPIPDVPTSLPKDRRIISPSLSSASGAGDEEEDDTTREERLRQRQALSPSPEVDLSSPELDDDMGRQPHNPGAPFSGRNSVERERSASASIVGPGGRRADSPPLEREERDFKQIATAVYEEAQKRRTSAEAAAAAAASKSVNTDGDSTMETGSTSLPSNNDNDTEETRYEQNREAAADLFGQDHLKAVDPSPRLSMLEFSSPVIAPRDGLHRMGPASRQDTTESGSVASDDVDSAIKQEESDVVMDESDAIADGVRRTHLDGDKSAILTAQNGSLADTNEKKQEIDTHGAEHTTDVSRQHEPFDWDATLRSPETVDLDELDDLFDAY